MNTGRIMPCLSAGTLLAVVGAVCLLLALPACASIRTAEQPAGSGADAPVPAGSAATDGAGGGVAAAPPSATDGEAAGALPADASAADGGAGGDAAGADSARDVPPEPTPEELEYARTHFADGSPIVTAATAWDGQDTVLLTFAGDLMAHRPNWEKGQFQRIYEDIAPLLRESDAAFANMETPVCDSLPYDTYPTFNVHGDYAQAAIDAGFNVFSLANNHTNDKSLAGMRATKAWFDSRREQTAGTGRAVYSAGLKERAGGPLTWQLVEAGGWKVLFIAVTEILNSGDSAAYIDYYYPSGRNRDRLVEEVAALREAHPCDLFVASIHCGEPEYVLTVAPGQREFYYRLLGAGADVVWVNHPHVSKGWEVIADGGDGFRKVIFYSMGNSISAQRTSPSFGRPETSRDYTGDGYMAQVRFLRDGDGVRIVHVNPVLLTTYIEPDGMYVIRVLDDSFISSLREAGRPAWASYLEQRKTLMEQIQGTTIWQ